MSAVTSKDFNFNQDIKQAKTISFKSDWHNGTGYLDSACYDTDAGLKAGEIGTCKDEEGRRILMVATPLGNIVLFERYAKEDSLLAVNSPNELERLVRTGPVSEDLYSIIINGQRNIGKTLAGIYKAMSAKLETA